MRTTHTATVALTLAGCGHINGLLPKNNDSMVTEHEVLCLTTATDADEMAVSSFILAPMAKAGAGLIIDKGAGAIEQESKLYKSTYTARLPDKLLLAYKTAGGREEKIRLRISEITFVRYADDPKSDQLRERWRYGSGDAFYSTVEFGPVGGQLPNHTEGI